MRLFRWLALALLLAAPVASSQFVAFPGPGLGATSFATEFFKAVFGNSDTGVTATTASVTPLWPTHVINDIAILACETSGAQATLSTANGFTEVPGSPVDATTTKLSVFWARATSNADAAPVVAHGLGDHIWCRMVTYKGIGTTGNPWVDTPTTTAKSAASTTSTWPSITTTKNNSLIVYIGSRDNDSAAAAWSSEANANLTAIVERIDNGTTSGDGGGVVIWDGLLATAGVAGTATATVTSSANGLMTMALKPYEVANGPGTTVMLAINTPLANGSTTMTDDTGRHTLVGYNSIAWTTTVPPGGSQTSSVLANGTTQYINETSDSADHWMGTGNWTIEMMFKNASTAASMIVLTLGCGGSTDLSVQFQYDPAFTSMVGRLSSDGANWDVSDGDIQGPVSAITTTGAWHHVAYVHYGNINSIYVGGTKTGGQDWINAATPRNVTTTTTCSGNVPIRGPFQLFTDVVDNTQWTNGNISNVKITKGKALYTANFTPPTLPLTQ